MFIDRKINTIASVVTAVITFIGVAAALVYYLSLDTKRDWFDKFISMVIFSTVVLATIIYTKKKVEKYE